MRPTWEAATKIFHTFKQDCTKNTEPSENILMRDAVTPTFCFALQLLEAPAALK